MKSHPHRSALCRESEKNDDISIEMLIGTPNSEVVFDLSDQTCKGA